jgi:hypothetical protein
MLLLLLLLLLAFSRRQSTKRGGAKFCFSFLSVCGLWRFDETKNSPKIPHTKQRLTFFSFARFVIVVLYLYARRQKLRETVKTTNTTITRTKSDKKTCLGYSRR